MSTTTDVTTGAGTTAGAPAADAHEVAELRDNLLALRAQWATRRAKREAHRETADGPSARLASIEHDIYARVIDELDAVLNATGEAGCG